MKLVLRLSVVLILILAIGLGALYYFRNGLIEASVESAGKFAFGVPTPLDGVETDLGSGRFALDGYAISNPPGFSSRPVFELGKAEMELPLGRLRGDGPIEIEEVRVTGLHLALERTSEGFNFSPLVERVRELTQGADAATGGGAKPSEPSGSTQARRGEAQPPHRDPAHRVRGLTLDADFGSGLEAAHPEAHRARARGRRGQRTDWRACSPRSSRS
ncbi:MAG: hypothetical protein R3F34_02300 [Planctomycetota bacterium]